MSLCEELKQAYRQAGPEQRLEILRREMLRPLVTVEGVAMLLREYNSELAQRLPENITPEEFDQLLRWLSEACDDLHQIVQALNEAAAEPEPHPGH